MGGDQLGTILAMNCGAVGAAKDSHTFSVTDLIMECRPMRMEIVRGEVLRCPARQGSAAVLKGCSGS